MAQLISKGDLFEYRLMRMLFYQGYLPRRNFILKTTLDARLSDATDIDVLAVTYDTQLIERRLVCECKSGKSRPIADILALSTIKQIVGSDIAIYALPTAPWDVKEFGSKADVMVLSRDRINQIEEEIGIVNDYWVASTDYAFFESKWESWEKMLKSDRFSERLIELLQSEYWLRQPWPMINRLMAALSLFPRKLSLAASDSEEREFLLWLAYETTIFFAITCLRVCSKVYSLAQKDREGMIAKYLTYGDLDPLKAQEIVQAAYKLAWETARQSEQPLPPFDFPPPDYTENFIDLITRLCLKPRAAMELARTLELALIHSQFRGRPIDYNEMSFFIGIESYEFKLKAAKDLVAFLLSTTGMPQDIFSRLLDA